MIIHKKPWGHYQILSKGGEFQVKRILVGPKLRLSLQKHKQRAETWIVVSGVGKAVAGNRTVKVKAGSVVQLAIGQKHRMENTGSKPLEFIEIQFGKYLGEDDIVRLEDDFNRAKKN